VEHLVVLLLVGLLVSRIIAPVVMLGSSRKRFVANFGVSCGLLLEPANSLDK
jgi:hypothetical protein